MDKRSYVAISIKHSMDEKSKIPVLWGYNRTKDDEQRCFSGYTNDIDKCELYPLEDFQNEYGNSYIKCDEPVKMCFDYCKRHKKYDTVLVPIDELRDFLSFL